MLAGIFNFFFFFCNFPLQVFFFSWGRGRNYPPHPSVISNGPLLRLVLSQLFMVAREAEIGEQFVSFETAEPLRWGRGARKHVYNELIRIKGSPLKERMTKT